MTPLEEELLELVVALADAVQEARHEFEALSVTPMPMPDAFLAQFEEREVLLRTLKRVSTEGGAQQLAAAGSPKQVREFVEAVFREERDIGADVDDSMPGWPVMDHVEKELDAAYDTVRRRRLLVPELYRALGPL